MEAYIIHFDDKPWEDLDDELYYRCSEIPWFSTTKTTISRLIPYTEDSAYAHGYTEAESKYREIRDELEKQAYQRGYKEGYNKHDTERIRKQGYDKGLDDIGNALRLLLFQYSNYTLQEIFGYDTARAVVEHFEGSEIVARIRCYEGGVKQDVETIRKEAYDKGYETAKHECEDCQKIRADAEQELVKKAYDTAYKDAEEIYESGKRAMYQKGLKDAWEAARKIYGSATKHGLPTEVITKIFRDDGKENFNYWDIVEDFSPAEAIERIRQYEQKQNESEESKKEQSVTVEEVMRQYLETFCLHAGSCVGCPLHTPDFTCGRGYHFLTKPVSDEEVRRAYATVLQKMKEN